MGGGGVGGSTRQKELTLAKISLAIAIVFIVSHSVKWIPNFYELVNVSACYNLLGLLAILFVIQCWSSYIKHGAFH